MLILYLPWQKETDFLSYNQRYTSKFYESDVQAVVEQNRSLFEPDAEAINKAFEAMKNNEGNARSFNFMNDQENSDIQDELQNISDPSESFNEQQPSDLDPTQLNQYSSATITYHNQPSEMMNYGNSSLNSEQRYAYDIVLSWCRSLLKNMNSLKPAKVNPIYLFLTGGGGAGKSHLIKTIYHTAVKIFRHPPFNSELPTVLLLAPTGVSAININETTVNTGLVIPKETGDYLPGMSDQKKTVQNFYKRPLNSL